MIYLTKRFHFSASHRIYNPSWSDEKNFEVFGKCSNPHGHGHNYVLEVTVAGEPGNDTGYVLDLTHLKRIVNENLIDKVDHTNLNIDVDFMHGINPTSENIVSQFWKILEPLVNRGSVKLASLRLFESENNIAEYRGNNEQKDR
jgi:6-pyruvoyltetrahydropterin/6-carboxytetrahydropterin synthase